MASNYKFYSYTFTGRCVIEEVVACTPKEAKLTALLKFGPGRNDVNRQVADVFYANSHPHIAHADLRDYF